MSLLEEDIASAAGVEYRPLGQMGKKRHEVIFILK